MTQGMSSFVLRAKTLFSTSRFTNLPDSNDFDDDDGFRSFGTHPEEVDKCVRMCLYRPSLPHRPFDLSTIDSQLCTHLSIGHLQITVREFL